MSLRGEAVAISGLVPLRFTQGRNDADLKLLQLSLHPRGIRGGNSLPSKSLLH